MYIFIYIDMKSPLLRRFYLRQWMCVSLSDETLPHFFLVDRTTCAPVLLLETSGALLYFLSPSLFALSFIP